MPIEKSPHSVIIGNMRRSFELVFDTNRGSFRTRVMLNKSYDERISFKTGYEGQPVKWIKVVTKDPELVKVTSRKEIKQIVQQDELESLFPTGEEKNGRPEYVVVDKAAVKNLYPSSDLMAVLRVVPLHRVEWRHFSDAHYFLNVGKTKHQGSKKQVTNPEDEAMYGLIRYGLEQNSEALLVKYNAMNNCKYGLVYAGPDGLYLTNLIGTNLQRPRDVIQPKPSRDPSAAEMYNRLVRGLRAEEVGPANDDYADKLQELADAAVRGETVQPVIEKRPACFARLAALAEPDEDEKEPPKKKKSRASSDDESVTKKKSVSSSDESDDEPPKAASSKGASSKRAFSEGVDEKPKKTAKRLLQSR